MWKVKSEDVNFDQLQAQSPETLKVGSMKSWFSNFRKNLFINKSKIGLRIDNNLSAFIIEFMP